MSSTIKLRKNGKPDKRSESSRKNIEKARKVVSKAIKKVKGGDSSSDEYEEDTESEDEYITEPVIAVKKHIPVPVEIAEKPDVINERKMKELELELEKIRKERLKDLEDLKAKEKTMRNDIEKEIKESKIKHMRNHMLLKF